MWFRTPKLDAILRNQAEILRLLNILVTQEQKLMATLNDVQNAVTAEDTVIDSAITLIQGLADQIKNLQPKQAAIDKLAADVSAKSQALAAAVAANTPAQASGSGGGSTG